MGTKYIIAFVRSLIVLFAACAYAGAFAASSATPGNLSSIVIQPLTLINFTPLNFGKIVAGTTAGTVTVDPVAGAVSATGGAKLAGGTVNAAYFESYGGPLQTLTVNRGPLPILSDGAGHTMAVSGLTLDGATRRFLGTAGLVKLNVGGTLNVGANQAAGNYTATFLIYVTYQ